MLNVCGMGCFKLLGEFGDGHAYFDFSEAEIPADSIRNVTLEQARGQEIGFTLWFKTVETC